MKRLTKRQISDRTIKALKPWQELLVPERPRSLRPEIRWGLLFDVFVDEGTKLPTRVRLTVAVVKPEYLSETEPTRLDEPPLNAAGVARMEDARRAVRDVVDVPVSWTWTIGCHDISSGNLIGLTEV